MAPRAPWTPVNEGWTRTPQDLQATAREAPAEEEKEWTPTPGCLGSSAQLCSLRARWLGHILEPLDAQLPCLQRTDFKK